MTTNVKDDDGVHFKTSQAVSQSQQRRPWKPTGNDAVISGQNRARDEKPPNFKIEILSIPFHSPESKHKIPYLIP
jgi:hypothetical protein